MQIRVYIAALLGVALAAPTLAQSDMNMQGMSGLFNVPDASVLEYGTASLSYDRQVDARFSADPQKNDAGNDMVFGAGIFPHVEVAGRNVTTTSTAGGSDLSFNLKLQSPWQWFEGLDFAIGQMDVGGSVNEYDTTYGVATWQYGMLRATLGAGKVSGKATSYTQRLDGAFGGLEVTPWDWLSLIAEQDGYSANLGVRVGVPDQWLPAGWRLTGSLMVSGEEGARDDRTDWYGFNLQVPLAGEKLRKLPQSQPRRAPAPVTYPVVTEGSYGAEVDKVQIINGEPDYQALDVQRQKIQQKQRAITKVMVAAGFEKVRVQRNGPRWIVAYENPRFKANEVDGLGVAAGLVSQQLNDNEFFYLQLEKYALPVFGLGGNAKAWLTFLAGKTAMPPSELIVAPRNELRRTTSLARYAVASTRHYLGFRPTVTIRPAISSTVGTEFGVFDYSLATRVDLNVPLWQGAAINVTRDWSTYETDDFTEDGDFGGVFLSQAIEDGVKNKVFSQAARLGAGFTGMVSYGEFFGEYEGTLYEGRWEPGQGRHRFRVLGGDLEEIDFRGTYTQPMLASWRYFVERTNSQVNVQVGRFLEGDEGFKVDVSQHIGNVRLHITLKESENAEFAGIGFSVPLTPQREMRRIAGIQVVGSPHFRYDVSSQIGTEGSNPLVFGPNRQPEQYYSLRNAYYNGDRLSPAYVRANQERMPMAWQKYGAR